MSEPAQNSVSKSDHHSPNTNSQSQFYHAIIDGDIARVETALAHGASINAFIDGKLPICIALENGEIDLAIRLLQHGPDLTLPPLDDEDTGQKRDPSLPIEVKGRDWWLEALLAIGLNICFLTVVGKDLHRILGWEWLFEYKNHLENSSWVFCCILSCSIRLLIRGKLTTRLSLVVYPGFVVFLVTVIVGGAFQERTWRVLVRNSTAILITLYARFAFAKEHERRSRTIDPPRFAGLEICQSFLASQFKNEVVLSALLDQDIFNAEYIARSLKDENGLPFRMWAAAAELGFNSSVTRLLDLGLPVDVLLPHRPEKTALALAAQNGHASVVETLLKHGADASGAAGQGEPPLDSLTPLIRCLRSPRDQTAVPGSYVLILLLLLGASEDAKSVDRSQTKCPTALMLAIQSQNHGIGSVKALLQKGADPNATDGEGGTAVHYAVRNADALRLVDLLKQHGAELDTPDNNGHTPLLDSVYRATHSSRIEVFRKLLFTHDANPFATTTKGISPLQVVAEFYDFELLNLVLGYTGCIEFHEKADNSILIAACRRKKERTVAVAYLLQAGADPNGTDPGRPWDRGPGRTPLHEACAVAAEDEQDQFVAISALIACSANVNAKYSDAKYKETNVTPIGLAASRVPSSITHDVLKALLDAGADPNGHDNRGLPAISALCANCEPIRSSRPDESLHVPLFIRRLVPVFDMYSVDMEENDQAPPLNEQAIKLLLERDSGVAAMDSEGKTCLHHAAGNLNFSAIQIISRYLMTTGDSSESIINSEDFLGRTPLHLACCNDKWTTNDGSESWGERRSASVPRAPISWIKKNCNLSSKTLQEIHKNGANFYARDSHKSSALHIAAKTGNPRITAWLLLATGPGLVYGCPDELDRRAFHYAVNSAPVTRLLLEFDRSGRVDCGQYFGVLPPEPGPLATAREVEQAYEEAESQSQANADQQPLLNAGTPQPWWRGNALCADNFGNNPVHYAALMGNAEVLRLYLQVPELDLNFRNNDGDTAVDYALENRACAVAIFEKFPHLAPIHGANSMNGIEQVEKSRNRQKADEFIERLRINWLWSVYQEPLRTSGAVNRRGQTDSGEGTEVGADT